MKLYGLIALISIYIASLLVLGHAVLPHCHSGETEACVILCHNHSHCSDDDCNSEKHHSCEGKAGNCILTQIVPQFYLSSHDILPDISDSNVDLLFCSCILELLKLDIPYEVLELTFWEQEPYYTSYISPTLGLRAPPCI